MSAVYSGDESVSTDSTETQYEPMGKSELVSGENVEPDQYTSALQKKKQSREEAIKLMQEKGEKYKIELIEDLPEGEEISFYKQGDFTDLCAGPHLESTGKVKTVKILSSSGAYWRGNENNKMLTRIYGTAFAKKSESGTSTAGFS